MVQVEHDTGKLMKKKDDATRIVEEAQASRDAGAVGYIHISADGTAVSMDFPENLPHGVDTDQLPERKKE